MLETTQLTQQQTLYLKTLGSSGKSLLKVIDDILDLSTIEARRIKLIDKPFALKPLVQEVLALLQSSTEKTTTEAAPGV